MTFQDIVERALRLAIEKVAYLRRGPAYGMRQKHISDLYRLHDKILVRWPNAIESEHKQDGILS